MLARHSSSCGVGVILDKMALPPPNGALPCIGCGVSSAWAGAVSQGYLVCGNSGRSNQTLSMRAFVLHRLDVRVHPFTKSQRTW